jgi:ribonuclease HI
MDDIEIEHVEVFTDGACVGNPGPGGWAALIIQGGTEQVLTGRDPSTTNNRMEMTAAITALEALPPGSVLSLYSDSQIVVKGISEWLDGWKRRGWRNATRKPVANRDLWERLDKLNAERQVEWLWIKGHAGNEHNERVDLLAELEAEREASAKLRQIRSRTQWLSMK